MDKLLHTLQHAILENDDDMSRFDVVYTTKGQREVEEFKTKKEAMKFAEEQVRKGGQKVFVDQYDKDGDLIWYQHISPASESGDLSADEIEVISEEELDKFGKLLQSFGHNTEELQKLIDTQPIRIAQRLLRMYGDDAESQVKKIFPDMVDRDKLLFNLSQQRKRYSDQQWSKYGLVRKY